MYKIYAVSDSIGETSELVARATASQFRGMIDVERVPYVKTFRDVDEFLEHIDEPQKCMIVSTIITVDVRKHLLERCIAKNIHVMNILRVMHKYGCEPYEYRTGK